MNIVGGPSEAVCPKNVGLIFVDNRPASPSAVLKFSRGPARFPAIST